MQLMQNDGRPGGSAKGRQAQFRSGRKARGGRTDARGREHRARAASRASSYGTVTGASLAAYFRQWFSAIRYDQVASDDFAPKVCHALVERDKDFLGQVFSVSLAGGVAAGQPMQARAVGIYERRPGAGVTGSGFAVRAAGRGARECAAFVRMCSLIQFVHKPAAKGSNQHRNIIADIY